MLEEGNGAAISIQLRRLRAVESPDRQRAAVEKTLENLELLQNLII